METGKNILDPVLRLLERLIKAIKERRERRKKIEEEKDKKFKKLRELDIEIKIEEFELRKKRNNFIKRRYYKNPTLTHYS